MKYKITCLFCGGEKEVRSDAVKKQKFCSISCARKHYFKENGKEIHPSWKGGRRITGSGYIEIHDPSHPRARKNGYVFEHILVMEKKVGRSISKDEDVHHKDENKQNNDPDNLELLTKSEHSKKTQESRRKKRMFPCVRCGKEVYRKPSHIKKIKQVFCSLECVGLWTYENEKGVFKK